MENVAEILNRYYPESVQQLVNGAGTTIKILASGEKYAEASPILSAFAIDSWETPPAGLFVVNEAKIILRQVSAMTLCHEYGHALDRALGGGGYLSGHHAGIRAAFRSATSFVTPYAASALDEFFAECVRAYVEANNPLSSWKPVSQASLRASSPYMFNFLRGVFA